MAQRDAQYLDGPVFPAHLAPGDGFVAFLSAGSGPVDVHVILDGEVFAVTREGENQVTNLDLDAEGHWVAWSRQRVASLLPGEVQQRLNHDLVVYDMDRQAQVFDSGTSAGNETRPIIDGDRAYYLDDASGRIQTMTARLSGSRAFVPSTAFASEQDHIGLSADGGHLAVLSLQDGHKRIHVVPDGGQAYVLAEDPERGSVRSPVVSEGRIAYMEFLAGHGAIHIHDLVTGDHVRTIAEHGPDLRGFAMRGDMVVAEVIQNGTRHLVVHCEDGASAEVRASRSISTASIGDEAIYYLQSNSDGSHAWTKPITCGEFSPARRDSERTPAPGVGVVMLSGTIARWLRCARCRRRSST